MPPRRKPEGLVKSEQSVDSIVPVAINIPQQEYQPIEIQNLDLAKAIDQAVLHESIVLGDRLASKATMIVQGATTFVQAHGKNLRYTAIPQAMVDQIRLETRQSIERANSVRQKMNDLISDPTIMDQLNGKEPATSEIEEV
jgi:hypothetical protein